MRNESQAAEEQGIVVGNSEVEKPEADVSDEEVIEMSGGTPEEKGLGVKQRAAMESLISGFSAAETARALGVGRSTMYRWLRDPVFQAEYNQWREQVETSCQTRLLTMAEKAADAVEKALEKGDGKLGMQLLKGMGILKERPAGLTNAEEIQKRDVVEEVKRQIVLDVEMAEIRVATGGE